MDALPFGYATPTSEQGAKEAAQSKGGGGRGGGAARCASAIKPGQKL
jgi:hypothetical protein